jgi:hypothetical protein
MITTTPRAVPIVPATATGTNPVSRLRRAPQSSRLRMSRPSPSVPNRWPWTPKPCSRSAVTPTFGEYGAINGARMAASSVAPTTNAATVATGPRLFRRRWRVPVEGNSVVRGLATVRVSLDMRVLTSLPPCSISTKEPSENHPARKSFHRLNTGNFEYP